MSSNRLTILERVALELLWALCYFVGHLPHYFQFYFLAPMVRFIVYRLLRYRVKVVDKNLLSSFPERSDEERAAIRDGFYTYLSEIFISYTTLTRKDANREIMTNLDPQKESSLESFKAMTQEHSWVALSAHFGLWEYEMFWATYTDRRLICVYHPLENRVFDTLFKRLRNHHKVMTMPAKESLRFALRNGESFRGESYVMGLLADQNPPLVPNSYWHTFLNQDTIFFDGGEKMALRIPIPVNFVYQRRVSPGRYELCIKPLWDGVESVEPNEITCRYVKMLEQTIRETPYMWLWSHKRWKRSRKSVEQAAWAKNQKGA
ncbi:MAG: lysophospholipid acyltransferase family protein [Rikenellaceae bacterium]